MTYRFLKFINRISLNLFSSLDLSFWITSLCIIFISFSIFSNSQKFLELSIYDFDFRWIFLGMLISCASIYVNAIAWKSLLNWIGFNKNDVQLISLYVSSNLMKYLPGGIWHFVERLRVLRVHIGREKALASVLLEPLLMIAAAFLWLPFAGWQSGILLLSFFPSILFTSNFIDPIFRFVERIKSKQIEKVDFNMPNLKDPNRLKIGNNCYPYNPLFIEMLFILLRFGGFFCCLKGLSLSSSISFWGWMSNFCLAWSVGLIVPAAPGGLGVFEAFMLFRVNNLVPEASLISILVVYRIIVTLSDFITGIFTSRNKIISKIFKLI